MLLFSCVCMAISSSSPVLNKLCFDVIEWRDIDKTAVHLCNKFLDAFCMSVIFVPVFCLP